jgi:hypothetical protein
MCEGPRSAGAHIASIDAAPKDNILFVTTFKAVPIESVSLILSELKLFFETIYEVLKKGI